VHDASLTSSLDALGRIGNRLSAVVHVAQTARCEFDSGLTPSLKETQRRDPEGRKEDEPPSAWRSETKEDASEQGSGHQSRDAQSQAPLLAAQTNVRNVVDGSIPFVPAVQTVCLSEQTPASRSMAC
jgi:hypothetical protein